MRYAHTTAQIRAAEEPLLADGDDRLMQRAAEGLAAEIRRALRDTAGGTRGREAVLLVGPGDNGGDALYAGVRLLRAGARVRAWCVSDRFHRAAARAFQDAGGQWLPSAAAARRAFAHAHAIVDGIFGIGGRPGLPPELVELARAAQASPALLVAVDVPSGLDADTGSGDDCFTADLTVTFGSFKPVHLTQPGVTRCGRVRLIDIGLDLPEPALAEWEPADVAAAWPWPAPRDDKYSRGVVGIDAGSPGYAGAAHLAVSGARHSGAGMVRFLGEIELGRRIVDRAPDVVAGPGRCQAYLLGSGWGERADGRDRIESVLAAGLPAVIDADGLRQLPERLERALLTPHAGELARLLGVERAEVEADPVTQLREAVRRTGATILLKGATQYVAGPDRDTVDIAVPGPAWTARAGSGDTLAGICATLLAAGLTARRAAVAAASIQALTARACPGPFPPDELAARLPGVLARLETGDLL